MKQEARGACERDDLAFLVVLADAACLMADDERLGAVYSEPSDELVQRLVDDVEASAMPKDASDEREMNPAFLAAFAAIAMDGTDRQGPQEPPQDAVDRLVAFVEDAQSNTHDNVISLVDYEPGYSDQRDLVSPLPEAQYAAFINMRPRTEDLAGGGDGYSASSPHAYVRHSRRLALQAKVQSLDELTLSIQELQVQLSHETQARRELVEQPRVVDLGEITTAFKSVLDERLEPPGRMNRKILSLITTLTALVDCVFFGFLLVQLRMSPLATVLGVSGVLAFVLLLRSVDTALISSLRRREKREKKWHWHFAVVQRVVIALVLAPILAAPVLLTVFRTDVDAHMQSINVVSSGLSTTADEPSLSLRAAQARVAQGQLTLERLRQQQRSELEGKSGTGLTGRPGAGPEYQQIRGEVHQAETQLALDRQKLQQMEQEASNADLLSALNERQHPGAAEDRSKDGFLGRLESLMSVLSASWAGRVAGVATVVLIAMIGLLPISMKIFMSGGDDTNLRKRRHPLARKDGGSWTGWRVRRMRNASPKWFHYRQRRNGDMDRYPQSMTESPSH